MDIQNFEQKVNQLLVKRKMMPSRKVGLKAFCKYFMAFAWEAHCREGDGLDMLAVLMDDDLLIGGEKFNTNFVLKFEDLYPERLKNNRTWQRLMPTLVEFKGKGLGVGELYLALVIQGWSFERTNGKGDGRVAGGIRELKNNGASLKPLAEAIRVQDQLNAQVFQGHRAGPATRFQAHLDWIQKQKNPQSIYQSYFSKLYPGRDVATMSAQLAKATDATAFYNIIGHNVLKWYQTVDQWNSLVIIDQDKMVIANIADVDDLSMFKKLRFDWKSERGGDTQAITDGYVNIKI